MESEFGQMSNKFKGKVEEFSQQISESDQKGKERMIDIQRSSSLDQQPYAYHDQKQLCERGHEIIDPETGLVYFKYDFGYEFGVVVPGDGKGKDKAIEVDSDKTFVKKFTKELKPTVGTDVSP